MNGMERAEMREKRMSDGGAKGYYMEDDGPRELSEEELTVLLAEEEIRLRRSHKEDEHKLRMLEIAWRKDTDRRQRKWWRR